MSAADWVVLAHFAFVAFVVGGGLLALRWPWLAWLHVPAAVWGVAIEWGGFVCPLTYLEHALREGQAGAGPAASFVERHLLRVLYPTAVQEGLAVRIALGGALLVGNAVVYGILVRRRFRRASPRP